MTRRALVVGGASGIGAASAQALAADGCAVTVADRDEAAARAVAAELGGDAAHVEVTDEASVAALFAGASGPLDVVVNSAGSGSLVPLVDLSAEEFRQVLDVNLTGAFHVLKHAAPQVRAGGSITTLSSLNGRQPAKGMAAYCAAKAGVDMLTQVAALELGPRGIRVNAVAPGLVLTPLTAPLMQVPGLLEEYLDNTAVGRAGTPEDVAQAVVYLSRADWLTGTVLDLNGGAHLLRYPDIPGRLAALPG